MYCHGSRRGIESRGHRDGGSRHPRPEEMEAYERLLGDAIAGDATLFARQELCGRGVASRRSRAESRLTDARRILY
jgi:hypothetical protein